jgi:Ring finger domain
MRLLEEGNVSTLGKIGFFFLGLVILLLCVLITLFFRFSILCDNIMHSFREKSSKAVEAKERYSELKRERILELFRSFQTDLASDNFKSKDGCDIMVGQLDVNRGTFRKNENTNESSTRILDQSYQLKSGKIGPSDTLMESESKVDESTFVLIPDHARGVPNSCAICLSPYEVGDTIVWSSNPMCEHAFHAECMIHWSVEEHGPPHCPCCRKIFIQDSEDAFVDLEKEFNNKYPG